MDCTPFTIAIDTREQLPYRFAEMRLDRKKVIAKTERKGLPTGDYSIIGFENRVCVERKSVLDLYGTLTHGRERFERELERMQTFDTSMVIIEASWQFIANPELFDPVWYLKTHPNSIIGTIVSFAGKFAKTQWKAAGSRINGEKEAFRFLQKFFYQCQEK